MNKLLSVCSIACRKQNETASIETVDRKDPTVEFGRFTPTVIRYSENNSRVDISFVETTVVLTLNLKEKNSNAYLALIKSAIDDNLQLLIYVYEDAMIGSRIELATVEK